MFSDVYTTQTAKTATKTQFLALPLTSTMMTSTRLWRAAPSSNVGRFLLKNGNFVESVPKWISRNGLNVRYKNLSVSLRYSYTAESFADPLNTVEPSATGAVGLVSAYGLLDWNARTASAICTSASM